MIFALVSIPFVVIVLALYVYPSYSEGKQMVSGQNIYPKQRPKLKIPGSY